MKIVSLEIRSQEEEIKYSPPIINVNRNVHEQHIRITRYYSMEQLSYEQWREEINWFNNINTTIDDLDVDVETRKNIIKFLGKKINEWFFHWRGFEPVSQMEYREVLNHSRWVQNVYKIVMRSELHADLAKHVIDLAVDECNARLTELNNM
jgi:hypothetical protein